MSRRTKFIATAAYIALLLALLVVIPTVRHDWGSAFYSWPSGSVWSNILAAFILGGPAIYGFFSQLEKHHKALREQADRHHAEHLAMMDTHHQAVKKLLG